MHLILDNYRIHSSVQVQAALARLDGRVVLHFLPPYCPDHNRIERVFVNLIGNALEAMPDGGTVCISAVVRDSAAVVRVRDNGPGIPEEIRERLFQPFVTSGKKGGLGLGLALARQTILEHGGDMWAESEPGQGACFVLRLPLRSASA